MKQRQKWEGLLLFSAILAIVAVVLFLFIGDKLSPEAEPAAVAETSIEVATFELFVVAHDEEVLAEEFSFQPGDTLQEVMLEELDIDMDGAFLTAIEGVSQEPDKNLWWVFTANDEVVNVGAADYALKDDDKITWTLTSFE